MSIVWMLISNVMGHLDMFPLHIVTTLRPLTGPNIPIQTTPRTRETHCPINTLRPKTQNALTVQTGMHPVPTAQSHSGTPHHLSTHHPPLLQAHCGLLECSPYPNN